MDEAKVMRVLGLASTQNLNKADPMDPENRRISIIVLNKKSEESLNHDDSTTTTLSDDAAGSKPLLQKIPQPDTAAPKVPPLLPTTAGAPAASPMAMPKPSAQ
jgi:chemotaxis protein MotB